MHIVTTPLKTGGKAEISSNLLKLLSLKHLNNLALNIINLIISGTVTNGVFNTATLSLSLGVAANGDRSTLCRHTLKERPECERGSIMR